MFSVALNNQWVLANFNIIAQSGGPDRALDKPFTVSVSTGILIIQLTSSIDNATISGIEVVSQTAAAPSTGSTTGTTTGTTGTTTSTTGTTTTTTGTTGTTTSTTGTTTSTTSTTSTGGTTGTGQQFVSPTGSGTVIRVSSGNSSQYTDAQGAVWAADYGYLGVSSTYSTGATITGTTSQPLYQNERWGTSFLYKFNVPNGSYTVNLKFAENYWTTVGRRLFSVAINNQWVLPNFDILAQAGGPYIALDKPFSVVVTTGAIIIQFAASVDNAKIDAIEILPQVTTTTSTQPVTTPVQVSLNPSFATLNAAGKSQFSATVTGTTNPAVQWSITPPIGTINSAGVYAAPSTVSSAQTVTVMATSLIDPTKTASAAISLVPTVSNVSSVTPTAPPVTGVSPNQASLTSSQAQQFSVTGLSSAMGTGGTITVAWSISPSAGSITQTGAYTAPSSISAQQTVTVSARDASSSALLGTASVTLTPSAAAPAPLPLRRDYPRPWAMPKLRSAGLAVRVRPATTSSAPP